MKDRIVEEARENPAAASNGILRKIVSLDAKEQIHGLEMLCACVELLDFPFFEKISSDEFVAGLRRVLDRKDLDRSVRNKLEKSIDSCAKRLEPLADLLPGLVTLRADLVAKGVLVDTGGGGSGLGEWIEQDAGGQDPEEFMAEVTATLKLFFDVVKTKKDKEALMTLAMNIDRYQEQLEVWINMLSDPSQNEYRKKAQELLDKTTQALDQYRSLRI
jgi:hypothetical protein